MKCDSCNVVSINGVACHEHGCPDAWRTETRECEWCGSPFTPTEPDHSCCSQCCAAAFSGTDCECDDCVHSKEDTEESND